MNEYSEIVPALLRAVPEFRAIYEIERMKWERFTGEKELSADAVFDEPLVGFLSSLLGGELSPADRDVLVRAFAFIESLAASDHDALSSVVATPFCRTILSSDVYARSLEFLGPKTRAFCDFMIRAGESI